MGLKGLKRSELPKFRDIWPKFYLLLPLVVLVYTVMQTGSFTMAYCAVVSSLVAIVASMMDREKGVGRKLLMLIPGIPLLIYAFFAMILYFNSGSFTPGELAGLANCALVVLVLSLFLYGMYRFTLGRVCSALSIRSSSRPR